ncbi:MAG: regulatory protein RecX [Neisseriaceae bacterium]
MEHLKQNDRKLKQYLFSLLARREYSAAELRQKLAQMGGEPSQIEVLLAEFKAKGWQSDTRCIQNIILSKQKRYGNLRLIQELQGKGIDASCYKDFLPSIEEQKEIALNVLAKKYRIKELVQKKQGAVRFLQSRGFSSEIAYFAVSQYLKDLQE